MCGDLGKAMRSRQMSFHVKWLNVDIFAYVSDYVGEFKKFIKNQLIEQFEKFKKHSVEHG